MKDTYSLSPVALFAYNRVEHIEKTLDYLKRNEYADSSDIYVFSDNAKYVDEERDVSEVRRFVKSIKGFKSVTVIERVENWGLLRSMIDGVSQVSKKHGRVIVLEDDIVTSPYFLHYMNQALDFYRAYKAIGSISGYVPEYIALKSNLNPEDIFYHYRTNCWGWGTWGDRWNNVDWYPQNWQYYFETKQRLKSLSKGGSDLPEMIKKSMGGKNQSWMARWYYYCFIHGMLTVYPGKSLVDNIGFDGSGTHSKNQNGGNNNRVYNRFRTRMCACKIDKYRFMAPIFVDDKIHKNMKNFWDRPKMYDNTIVNAMRAVYKIMKRTDKNKAL